MEQKYRLDLSAPPPPPGSQEAPPPTKDAPQERGPAGEKPKKRGGLVGLLVGVAAAAAVLLCGYRFVHFWSEPTCTQKAKCSICGLEQGDFAQHNWQQSGECDEPAVCTVCGEQTAAVGHTWTGGSCTESRLCAICGVYENQAPGHSYSGGSCTVCGAAQVHDVLRWEPGDFAQVGYSYQGDTGKMTIVEGSWEKLSAMKMIIRDWQGHAVSADRYTVQRSEEEVVLNLPADLAPGRYTIYAGVQETKVLEFWFGTEGEWMPAEMDQWYADFEVKSWKHGLLLAAFDEGAPLLGVQTVEEATRFGSPWQMSAAAVDEEGQRTLIQGGPNGGHSKFRADSYCRSLSDGTQEQGVVFSYEGWYLAMREDGTVFLSGELTENCIFIITSSL